ncbi:MAG: hypothetical protein ACREPN_05760 [Rudaea sp.]
MHGAEFLRRPHPSGPVHGALARTRELMWDVDEAAALLFVSGYASQPLRQSRARLQSSDSRSLLKGQIMRRDQWRFEYAAGKLAEAAAVKMKFHRERLEWWKTKRKEVMDKIRSEGLEIDEKIAVGYVSPKAQDWQRSSQISVRDDLRSNLDECQTKLSHHTTQLRDYDGWHQALSANPDVPLRLHIDDWLFFFDKV